MAAAFLNGHLKPKAVRLNAKHPVTRRLIIPVGMRSSESGPATAQARFRINQVLHKHGHVGVGEIDRALRVID